MQLDKTMKNKFIYILGCLLALAVVGTSCESENDSVDLSESKGTLTYYSSTTSADAVSVNYCKMTDVSSSLNLDPGLKAVDLYIGSEPMVANASPAAGSSAITLRLVFEDVGGLLPGGQYRKRSELPEQFTLTCLDIAGGACWNSELAAYEDPISIDLKEESTTDGDAFVHIIPMGGRTYQILFTGEPVSNPGCPYRVVFIGTIN